VYESQYGYAGKQGPYSESEYGSEYGEVEPGEHGIRRVINTKSDHEKSNLPLYF